ncbi:MAG: FAD-dependent oxidoreductase [Chthoniobacteraceae bacterium]
MRTLHFLYLLATLCTLAFFAASAADPVDPFDLVVYEGTPAGVTAAVAAARHGRSVALIEMNNHVGGVMSGGLVSTDIGDRTTVGGLSREFFDRILNYYSDKYGAVSKLPYRVGREARFEFNEYLGGIVAGLDKGNADERIMSYNYRISLTPVAENRVLFPEPAHYDPEL